MRSMCTFLHESIRLAPASFVYLKEAVFPLKLLERKSARFSLRAIDIEPSADRKMVVLFIATLIDGVAMKRKLSLPGRNHKYSCPAQTRQ